MKTRLVKKWDVEYGAYYVIEERYRLGWKTVACMTKNTLEEALEAFNAYNSEEVIATGRRKKA